MSRPPSMLMADDDEEDLELIEQAVLKAEPGATIHKLTHGKDVLKFLNGKRDDELPGVIILDYNMPELNGAQILQQINQQSRYDSIPKIIVSTSSAPLHIHECMSNGAAEYFVKPDNLKELDDLARKMLAIAKRIND